jgi:hypothetical protein
MTVSLTACLLLAEGTAWMRAASVLDEDGTGGSRVDRLAHSTSRASRPGSMSGPILVESNQECAVCHRHVGEFPEKDGAERRAS